MAKGRLHKFMLPVQKWLLMYLLDISRDDITVNKSVSNAECCQKVTDFERLMKSVKEKISISNTQEKMKLLILVPTS